MTRGFVRICIVLALASLAGACGPRASDYRMFADWAWASVSRDRSAVFSREDVLNVPYATYGLRMGSSRQGLIVLQDIQGRRMRWVSADRVVFTTRGARLASSAGLMVNLSDSFTHASDPVESGLLAVEEPVWIERTLDYRELRLIGIPAECQITRMGEEAVEIEVLGTSHRTIVFEERCGVPALDWRFTNTFWADRDTGMVWRSRQHIHPDVPVVELEVMRPVAN